MGSLGISQRQPHLRAAVTEYWTAGGGGGGGGTTSGRNE